MNARQCYEALAANWSDEVVICALGKTLYEWWRFTESDKPFYMHSSMGLASSFGLGLSLSLPQAQVWVLDSDGSFIMNMGSLLTEAQMQPANLIHFVLSNKSYDVLMAHPLVNSSQTNFAGLARSAGIENVMSFSTPTEIEEGVKRLKTLQEYAFVVLDVEPDASREDLVPLPYEGPEVKYRFGRSLEEQFGIRVFGPEGY